MTAVTTVAITKLPINKRPKTLSIVAIASVRAVIPSAHAAAAEKTVRTNISAMLGSSDAATRRRLIITMKNAAAPAQAAPTAPYLLVSG